MFTFIKTVIAMDKDFDSAWIKEYVQSRINLCDMAWMIEELADYASGNEINGASYAISQMEAVA